MPAADSVSDPCLRASRAQFPTAAFSYRTPVPRVEAATVGAVYNVAPVNGEHAITATDCSGDQPPNVGRRQALAVPDGDKRTDSFSGVDHLMVVLPAGMAGLRRLRTPARLRDRPAPNAAKATSRLTSWSCRSASGFCFACGLPSDGCRMEIRTSGVCALASLTPRHSSTA
jgi:hypothetical protein